MEHPRTIVPIVLMSVIASARAEVLYSIDADCNTLVRIDSTTGAVAVVGTLDVDTGPCADLALHGGTLYAVGYEFFEETRLFTIDPATATVTSTTIVTRAGEDVMFAEGLASANDQLYLGFYLDAPSQFSSNALGVVTLDGTITTAVTFADGDFDALGPAIGAHDLWGVDGCPTNEWHRLFRTQLVPPRYELAGAPLEGDAYASVSDVVETRSDLFLMGTLGTLYRVDPQTVAVVESIPLGRAGRYCGLAVAGGGSVCPADLDGSDRIDVRDLLAVLAAWGPCACCRADIDGDGGVDVRDLLVVLAAWGVCPS